MSESPVPPYVDTRKVFLQEGKICGNLSLEQLPRFRDSLISEKAEIWIELSFDTNQSKQRIISGSIRAAVEVSCQRCLEPLEIELSDDIMLVLLHDEALAEKLEPQLDPWICEDHKLELASLIEEQLLLCMPIVNYHASKDCVSALQYTSAEEKGDSLGNAKTESPFSVLSSLKDSIVKD